jgi:hypothetical protein
MRRRRAIGIAVTGTMYRKDRPSSWLFG